VYSQSTFRFNGKEFDQETGNYYYGARYYNPKTSLWLSVDPLVEKYPEWSPYNYTLNNPVRYVDPDGNGPLDYWRIDNEGNAHLIAKSDNGLFINGKEMRKFNFKNNIKAFKQIHSYYLKKAGVSKNIEFYVNSFDKKINLLETEIPDKYNIRSIPQFSAFSKKMSGEKPGFVISLTQGKVYDKTNYDNKYNLMSSLIHEFTHIEQNLGSESYSSFQELKAMNEQFKHKTWEKTTKRYKEEIKGYFNINFKRLKKYYENTESGRYWLNKFKSNADFD
jgi:RHS repeat-associated protein